MTGKVYVVVENYRDEKAGDSTEQVTVLAVHHSIEKAKETVQENFEKTLEIAEETYGKDNLYIETVSDGGAQICLEYEWDTFHADYIIKEMTV